MEKTLRNKEINNLEETKILTAYDRHVNDINECLKSLRLYLVDHENVTITEDVIKDKKLRDILLNNGITDYVSLAFSKGEELMKIEGFVYNCIRELIFFIHDIVYSSKGIRSFKDEIKPIKEKITVYLEDISDNYDEDLCILQADLIQDQLFDIISNKFGCNSRQHKILNYYLIDEMTYKEIGLLYNICSDNVRQILAKTKYAIYKSVSFLNRLVSLETNLHHTLRYIYVNRRNLYFYLSDVLSRCTIKLDDYVIKNDKAKRKQRISLKDELVKKPELSNIEMAKKVVEACSYLSEHGVFLYSRDLISYLLGSSNIDELDTYFGILGECSYKKVNPLVDALLYLGVLDLRKSKVYLGSVEILQIKEEEIDKALDIVEYKIEEYDQPIDLELFELLKSKCKKMCRSEGYKTESFFTYDQMQNLAKIKPTTVEEFISIKHISIKKYLKYGKPILDVINEYLESKK